MNILRAGDPRKILQTKRFLCLECGCYFEANNDEYEYGNQFEPGCTCKCPYCGQVAWEEKE